MDVVVGKDKRTFIEIRKHSGCSLWVEKRIFSKELTCAYKNGNGCYQEARNNGLHSEGINSITCTINALYTPEAAKVFYAYEDHMRKRRETLHLSA